MARGSGIKAGGRTGIAFSTNGISAPLDVSTKADNFDRSQDVGRDQFDGYSTSLTDQFLECATNFIEL